MVGFTVIAPSSVFGLSTAYLAFSYRRIAAPQSKSANVNVNTNVSRNVNVNASASVAAEKFIRGDANSDGKIDVGDVIAISNYINSQGTLKCLDAADINDDGQVNISDSTYLLKYLASQIRLIPEPFPIAGLDITLDNLGCQSYPQSQ